MKKTLVLLGVVLLFLSCGVVYKPEVKVPLTINIPDSLLSNAATAVLHPTPLISYRDTCLGDTLSAGEVQSLAAGRIAIAELDSLKRERENHLRRDKTLHSALSAAWIGLHITAVIIALAK